DRQHQDRNQRAPEVQEEQHADQRNDDAFLEQRALKSIDRGVDQVRTIVNRYDLDRFRQAGGDFPKPLLDVLDDFQRVEPEALQHDAAGDLALPVQFGDAATLSALGSANFRFQFWMVRVSARFSSFDITAYW